MSRFVGENNNNNNIRCLGHCGVCEAHNAERCIHLYCSVITLPPLHTGRMQLISIFMLPFSSAGKRSLVLSSRFPTSLRLRPGSERRFANILAVVPVTPSGFTPHSREIKQKYVG